MLEMLISFQYTKYDENRWPYIKLFIKRDVIDLKSVRLFCTIVTHCVLNLVHNFIQSDFDIFSKREVICEISQLATLSSNYLTKRVLKKCSFNMLTNFV